MSIFLEQAKNLQVKISTSRSTSNLKVSIKFNTYLRTNFRLLLRIFFSKIGYFSWMNFRNSKNNLSRYTNGLVFTKAGEYGEFFYLRELVCNLWQVMSSVVKPYNTSEDIRHKT